MPPLRLFNTLTREIEEFQPLETGLVRMYCCGPTVYARVHVGNLRTFLWGDLLRRYLEWKGYRVEQIMNLTDVDDRIIEKANEAGTELHTYTEPFIRAFFEDIDALRIRRAGSYPRATDHIAEMVALVERLRDAGHTYEADGSTYYRIATFPTYGRLARLELAQRSDYTRIESDKYEKDDARDFVLWKAKKEGEPSWPSPIGEGRPGWHLECSAMSMKYLGEAFDIHTGAVDLIFPHHENEIAQSEGATGHPFVRHWIHGEHLNVDDHKMSKSVGNIHTLPDLLADGWDTLQIRYALLAVPYRTKLNFTLRSLEDAKHALERLQLFLIRLEEIEASGAAATGRGAELAAAFRAGFESAMDDDLNTAGALGALFVMVREANIAADRGTIGAGDARSMLQTFEQIDRVLDIRPATTESVDDEIERMIEARNAARARRDFAESDRLRDQLLERGIVLEDTPAGTRWRRK